MRTRKAGECNGNVTVRARSTEKTESAYHQQIQLNRILER